MEVHSSNPPVAVWNFHGMPYKVEERQCRTGMLKIFCRDLELWRKAGQGLDYDNQISVLQARERWMASKLLWRGQCLMEKHSEWLWRHTSSDDSIPGILESFPKLRWKLEAQDKVYVCVWGGAFLWSHPIPDIQWWIVSYYLYFTDNTMEVWGTLANEGIEFGSENDHMVLHCLPVAPKQAKELPCGLVLAQ